LLFKAEPQLLKLLHISTSSPTKVDSSENNTQNNGRIRISFYDTKNIELQKCPSSLINSSKQ
jgi:hypothetical protein